MSTLAVPWSVSISWWSEMGGSNSAWRFLFRKATNSRMPSLKRNSCFLPVRSSSMVMRSPGFRKASSRRRPESVSKVNSFASKSGKSGRKVTRVPRRWVSPMGVTLPEGWPRS